MYCANCGEKTAETAVFCSVCGHKVNEDSIMAKKSIQFLCKGCNTVMKISADNPVLQCPCCGSMELIIENDDVTIERIKSKTVLEQQKSEKELELEKLYYEENKNERKRKREWKEVRILWTILTVVLLLFFGSIFLSNKIEEKESIGKVKFPVAYYECEGEMYTTITTCLIDAGFTNVIVKPLNDLSASEEDKNGHIYRIMVNGDPDITSTTMVYPEDYIYIYYHSMKE